MNNLFEGAVFGDKFITKDGKIARFVCITTTKEDISYCLHVEDQTIPFWYHEDGSCRIPKIGFNIISRYQESIDEDWMIEKGAYKCPKDSKNPQEWIGGFVEGIQYSLNHQFTNKIDEDKLNKLAESMSEGLWSDDLDAFEDNPQRSLIMWAVKRIYECGIKDGYHQKVKEL